MSDQFCYSTIYRKTKLSRQSKLIFHYGYKQYNSNNWHILIGISTFLVFHLSRTFYIAKALVKAKLINVLQLHI